MLRVLQAPPVGVHESVMTDEMHSEPGPVIGETVGRGFTEMTAVAATVPQLFVTV